MSAFPMWEKVKRNAQRSENVEELIKFHRDYFFKRLGDGGFGQNPAVLATARRERIPVVWVVMNNNAYGTIAGLEKANYGSNATKG